MTSDKPSQRFGLMASVALTAIVVVVYAPSFSGGFVWDDYSTIVLNDHVQSPGSALQLFAEDLHAFGRGQGNFYRPLQALSYLVEYALSSPMTSPAPGSDQSWISPFLFRVGNALWHALASILLLALLGRLGVSNAARFVICAIYAVHPIHTEAVAYISGRADSMAAAFMFASLYCALSARRGVAIGLSGLWFAAALLCKESATMLPVLLGALWIVTPGAEDRGAMRKALAAPIGVCAAILVVYGALRMTVLNFGSDTVPRDIGFGGRIVESMQSLALYAKLIFVPTGLHMERTLDGVPLWTAGIGAVIFAGLVAGAFVAWKRGDSVVAFGLIWFVVTWAPISGLFPLNAPMAEHWMYVPVAGFLTALVVAIARALKVDPIRRAGAALALAVTVVFAFLTVGRALDWTSNESLYLATLRENPATTRVHYNLAVTYEELEGNYPGARRHYQAVIDLYEDRREADGIPPEEARFTDEELESHMSLGRMALEDQQFGEALPHFARIVRLQPTNDNRDLVAAAAFSAGQCMLALGERTGAERFFDQAIAINPAIEQQVNRLMGRPASPAGA